MRYSEGFKASIVRKTEYVNIDVVQKLHIFDIKRSAFQGWGSDTRSGLNHELRVSFPIARGVVSGLIRVSRCG